MKKGDMKQMQMQVQMQGKKQPTDQEIHPGKKERVV